MCLVVFHQVPWILKVQKHPHVGSAPLSRSIPTSNGFFPEPHPTTKFGVNPLPSSVGGYKHLSERCHGPKKPTEMGNWKQQLITLLWVRIRFNIHWLKHQKKLTLFLYSSRTVSSRTSAHSFFSLPPAEGDSRIRTAGTLVGVVVLFQKSHLIPRIKLKSEYKHQTSL